MAKIDRGIDVNASGEQVFDLLTNLDMLPAWSTITLETHGTPSQPLEKDDTFTQTLRVLGRPVETTWQVEELRRPQEVTYRARTPGGGIMRMVQKVRDVAGNCRVEVELDYELPGGFLGEWMDAAYAERRNERELEHSLHNLKEFVENGRGPR